MLKIFKKPMFMGVATRRRFITTITILQDALAHLDFTVMAMQTVIVMSLCVIYSNVMFAAQKIGIGKMEKLCFFYIYDVTNII